MCCFSKPVISVSATSIFARPAGEGRQFLAYSMTLNATQELAMILPLPVKAGTDEKDISFIDLSGYPEFFADMRHGFRVVLTNSLGELSPRYGAASSKKLEVVNVGSFEASFVPTLTDFSRLDERFRISDRAWRQLPQYRDYGFAVFKLKSGEAKVHPMAFSFPRRNPGSLFFPTVHIHDGKVHARADFDHALYCQPTAQEQPNIRGWEESTADARRFMKVDKAKDLILADQHCYRRELRGMLPNADTVLQVSA